MTKPRVVVFSTIMPLPASRGDSVRLLYTLQHLKEVAQVCLVCLVREWEPPVTDFGPLDGIEFYPIRVQKREVLMPILKAVASGRPSVIYRFDTPRIADAVRRRIEAFQPDLYWGFQSDAYPFARFAPRSKRVLDLVDSLSMHYALVRTQKSVPLRTRLGSLAQPGLVVQERRAIAENALTLVSSAPNEEHLHTLHGQIGNLRLYYGCIPDVFLTQRWQPKPDRPPRLLFVGYLGYPPNEIAVRMIITQVLPLVRKQIPEAEFIVCGGGALHLREEYQAELGLVFKGFVPDLIAEYLQAGVSVVPVPYATGIQTKLMEAMAVGLPSVISEVSLQANGVMADVHVLAAGTDAAMADAIVAVLHDSALARRLSENGRSFIEAHHSWQAQRKQVSQIVHDALEGKAPAHE